LAITVKLNRPAGTTLTLGVADRRSDRAVRAASATGLSLDPHANDQRAAILQALGDAGLMHDAQTDLPLIDVQAVKERDQTFNGQLALVYGHNAVTTPPAAAWALAREEQDPIKLSVPEKSVDYEYQTDGSVTIDMVNYPRGSLVLMAMVAWDKRWVPVTNITVPTLLSSHPAATVDPLVGKVNDALYTPTGSARSFAADTLLYLGMSLAPVPGLASGGSAVVRYPVLYHFKHRPDGWVQYRLRNVWWSGYSEDPVPSEILDQMNDPIYTVSLYQSAAFSFPVHA